VRRISAERARDEALERLRRIEGAKPPSAPRAPADNRVLPCHVSQDGLVVIPQDLRAVLGVVNGGPVAFITNRAGRVEIEAAMVDPGNGPG
jgi:hypothetical protein